MDYSNLITILIPAGFILLILLLWLEKRNRKYNNPVISSFLDAASIPSFRNSIGKINQELSRARRSHSSLSVLVISLQKSEPVVKTKQPAKNSELQKILSLQKETNVTDFLLCGTVMRDALRDIDIITYAAANFQYIIVLPESTKLKAEYALTRIKEVVGRSTAAQFNAGIAEFPNDGLILEDLVAYATNSMNNESSMAHLDRQVDM